MAGNGDTDRTHYEIRKLEQHFFQGFQIDDIFPVIFQQSIECVKVKGVDVFPPQPDSFVAIDSFKFSVNSQLALDSFQAAFEIVPPAIVHQIAVREHLRKVNAEIRADER